MSYYNYTPTITQAATAAGQFVSHGADMVANIMMDTAKTNAQGTMAMATTVAGILQSGAERRARAAIASAQIQAQMITAKMNQSLEYARLASANANAAKERALKEREMDAEARVRAETVAAQKARDDFAIMDANRKFDQSESAAIRDQANDAEKQKLEREKFERGDYGTEGKTGTKKGTKTETDASTSPVGRSNAVIGLPATTGKDPKDKNVFVGGVDTTKGTPSTTYKRTVGGREYTMSSARSNEVLGVNPTIIRKGSTPSANVDQETRNAYTLAWLSKSPSVLLPDGNLAPNPKYKEPSRMTEADEAAITSTIRYLEDAKSLGPVAHMFASDNVADRIFGSKPTYDGIEEANNEAVKKAVHSNQPSYQEKTRNATTGEETIVVKATPGFSPFGRSADEIKHYAAIDEKLDAIKDPKIKDLAYKSLASTYKDKSYEQAIVRRTDGTLNQIAVQVAPSVSRVDSPTVQKPILMGYNETTGENEFAMINTRVDLPSSEFNKIVYGDRTPYIPNDSKQDVDNRLKTRAEEDMKAEEAYKPVKAPEPVKPATPEPAPAIEPLPEPEPPLTPVVEPVKETSEEDEEDDKPASSETAGV